MCKKVKPPLIFKGLFLNDNYYLTMSHCHDEHCDHDHSDLPDSGEQFLLYSKIDLDNVRCLNESEPNSGKKVIRPWNERMDDLKVRPIRRSNTSI